MAAKGSCGSVDERPPLAAQRPLGPQFRWLWGAFAISSFGTWIAFDAFPLIAILVLHAGAAEVSALASASLAVGAMLAVPLGPWVERRRKRSVMVAMDLLRFASLASVPAAYALGLLGFAQLLVVSVTVAACNIAFKAASGACLKALVPPESLLAASSRFEATAWSATMVGPPLGGAAIGLLGPVVTVIADAVSYLLSAAGIRAIGGEEPRPAVAERLRLSEVLEGWRHILSSPSLRPLFFNTVLVNGLILATAPLLAVLMLGRLAFAPWQYGLAFAAPCVGGLIGSRLASPLVARFGRHRVMLAAGALRSCWSLGLAFIPAGLGGLALVIGVQFGLVTSVGIFNPVFVAYRLERTPKDRAARTLSAWSVTSSLTIASLTALWGLLASITSLRDAIATAGLLMLGAPVLLLRGRRALKVGHEVAASEA